MMALHIPEENRSGPAPAPRGGTDASSPLGSGSHWVPPPHYLWGSKMAFKI